MLAIEESRLGRSEVWFTIGGYMYPKEVVAAEICMGSFAINHVFEGGLRQVQWYAALIRNSALHSGTANQDIVAHI